MADIIDKAIGVMIVAAVIPASLGSLHDANTTGFSVGELALWSLIGILVVVAVIKWVTS